MAKHAQIVTSIWRDRDFVKLSRDEQWLYFVLLSQPTRSLVGVVPYQPRKWSRAACDVNTETIDVALDGLERRRFVLVDSDTDELLIRTVVRHDPARGAAIAALWRAFDAVESDPLRRAIVRELPADTWTNVKAPPTTAALRLREEELPGEPPP